ncbi:MAG: hypothetical protein K0U78_05075 [Actinomycetia bacterium]|nr:hypothetical protein [Actinomycetes bacterium]
MIDNESLPTGDVQNQGSSEQELLDAVMRQSPIMDHVDEVPLPEEELSEENPVEPAEEEDDQDAEEVVSEEVEEEVEGTEEEAESGDDTSTEAEVFTAETLDLDAQVAVKIDGEEQNVSFADLIKGYTTEQSLSKKGRELGEARKALDEERNTALGEVTKLGQAATATLQGTEQALSKQYHELEASIEQARKDGDTFEMSELKDKREMIQKEYWTTRQRREGLMKAIEAQQTKVQEEAWNQQIKHFTETIPTIIPDFNDKVAADIRAFAIEEGINPVVLDQITDPAIVKFVDDYRRLKKGVNKGAIKRKAVPTKRVPAKKATPAKKKAQNKHNELRAKAFDPNASADTQMDFLKTLASNSLNNIK